MDFSQWWDRTLDKVHSKVPDFEHKITKTVLWIDDRCKPPVLQIKPASLTQQASQRSSLPNAAFSSLSSSLSSAICCSIASGPASRTNFLWKEFIFYPSQQWDNKSALKNSDAPDFKHKKELRVATRLDTPLVNSRLACRVHCQPLDPLTSETCTSLERLWQEFFVDPSQWWDERLTKGSLTFPDFIHKVTKEGLWIEDASNPRWVKAKMATMRFCHIQSDGDLKSSMGQALELSDDGDFLRRFSREGRLTEALHVLELIVQQNTQAPISVYSDLLRACARRKALAAGMRVHAIILQTGHDSHIFLGNLLIDMYAKCGSLLDARKIFDTMLEHNVFSWTAIISAYIDHGKSEEAMSLFQQMQVTGIMPDKVLYVVIIKACARSSFLSVGKQLHVQVAKRGFDFDVIIRNSLVYMYAKCGNMKCARELFDTTRERNVVSWNVMITGYANEGLVHEALGLCEQMKHEGLWPDAITYVVLLKACASNRALEQGKQLHFQIVKSSFESKLIIGNALVNMYAKCGSIQLAFQVFDNMNERDVVSWTAMILGYAQQGRAKEALALYEQMKREGMQPNHVTYIVLLKACASISALSEGRQLHAHISESGLELDVSIGNSLIDMYAKCRSIEQARHVFNTMRSHDVVSWTAMIAGYAQQGLEMESFALYEQMKHGSMQPNHVTYVVLLEACAHIGALERGKELHSHIIRGCLELDMVLGNALIDMYGKCGSIDHARQVFNNLHERDTVSWTAIIAGYAHEGLGTEALTLLEQMQREGTDPDEVTFVSVLAACSHSGLVNEGIRLFDSMHNDYGVTPTIDHYACLVDILGRSGRLVDAEDVISNMPFEPNALIWRTLLGAATNHGHVGVGRRAFTRLIRLEPEDTSAYVLLSNIFVAADMKVEAAKIRKQLKDASFKKRPACSWIEVGNQVHAFVAGEATHPQIKEIRLELNRLVGFMKDVGYVPDLSFALQDGEDGEKESLLLEHSEKLAVAFGLISMPPHMPIRIRKNVRVCGDCHNACKVISKIVRRPIIARDTKRFHHFENGFCSCGDYW